MVRFYCAGAGAQDQTITHHCELILSGVAPEKILAVTFKQGCQRNGERILKEIGKHAKGQDSIPL